MNDAVTHQGEQTTPTIPWQLQRDDILFVRLPRGEKGLHEEAWNLVSNGRKWDDLGLIAHITGGGNYGMYPAPGSSLLWVDVDNAEQFHDAGGEQLVGDTYRYSAWPDRQKYRAIVECPDMPDYMAGQKGEIKRPGEKKAAIEIFYPAGPITKLVKGSDEICRRVTEIKTAGQCVGPYSLHPNGNYYLPFDDQAPIKSISWDDLNQVCTTLDPEHGNEIKLDRVQQEYVFKPGQKLLKDRYNLQIVYPDNPYPAGNEIRGVNPWHGSESKCGNVAVNIFKGVFYCFRCGKGYDAAGTDAIQRGIINCGDDYNGVAFKKHCAELERDFPEVKALERIAWKVSRKQAGGNRCPALLQH